MSTNLDENRPLACSLQPKPQSGPRTVLSPIQLIGRHLASSRSRMAKIETAARTSGYPRSETIYLRDFGRERAARPAASPSGAEPDMGHERGRQQSPLAAIHLVANWLLPSPAEFDNQLI
jgi:hypothetical protein